IDREKECQMIKAILETDFKEICPLIGGIGTGKSSTAIYTYREAKKLDKNVKLINGLDDFEDLVENEVGDIDVIIVDDVDKVSDERAAKFYKKLESVIQEDVTIFYTDTYKRDKNTSDLREFTASQYITLPRRLNKDNLNELLIGRMKNCSEENDFDYPFKDEAIQMASIRSGGNIRRFFTYTKHAWTIYKGKNKKLLDESDMKHGMINVDRAVLGSLDPTDLKIVWYSTIGKPNKTLLAHQSDIHPKTLDNRIKEDLSGLVTQVREGQEVYVYSIYSKLSDGKKILEKILKDLEHFNDVAD
ncbi:MAG: hypothetical protein R6U17_04710, partial [Thermoplasmata archaeon]